MKIKISSDRKIFEIQEEFNTAFPYLKLEFFKKTHNSGENSPKKWMELSSKSLSEFKSVQDGALEIEPNMTVAFIEQEFKDKYGLGVQVFRKSGKVWLETTFTDGWTLEEQNNQGEALSKRS